MTRATRFLFAAAGLLIAALAAGEVAAQSYQPPQVQPGQSQPGQGQPQQVRPAAEPANPPSRYALQGPQPAQQQGPQQQPAQTKAFGPAIGPVAAQPNQGQPNQTQPGQIRPVAGEQPIRQPGPGAAAPPSAVNPLAVPRLQIVPAGPLQPEWFPLDPQVQTWVDGVLAYWEKRSDQVKTLECTFQKWEYDPGSMPDEFNRLKNLNQLHMLPFSKYAAGLIKYGAPDKGLFQVKQLQVFSQVKPGEKPQYIAQPAENGEHWITDGKRVFAFDAVKKEVIESMLPPEMQGKSLADGPLPFMFGARAESIKARYWIRPLQAEASGEYCLEAVPKSRQDAANFKMVQVVLDEKEYLPIKMQIFEGDWSPNNPHRTAYKFDKREVNAQNHVAGLLDPLKLWNREFYEVKTPSGWKRIARDANGNIVGPGGNTATAPGNILGPLPKLK